MVALSFGAAPKLQAARFLFDANHGQNAGNADWVVDADARNLKWTSTGTTHYLDTTVSPPAKQRDYRVIFAL